MAGWPFRLGTNRSNPYTEPGGYDKLKTEGHLETFGSYLCTSRPVPPTPGAERVPDRARGRPRSTSSSSAATHNRGKAPACDPQAPLGRLLGQAGMFPHLEPLP